MYLKFSNLIVFTSDSKHLKGRIYWNLMNFAINFLYLLKSPCLVCAFYQFRASSKILFQHHLLAASFEYSPSKASPVWIHLLLKFLKSFSSEQIDQNLKVEKEIASIVSSWTVWWFNFFYWKLEFEIWLIWLVLNLTYFFIIVQVVECFRCILKYIYLTD